MESPVSGRVLFEDVRANLKKIKATYYTHPADESNELLYHYTDLKGFLGIIESRKLWASNISFLNDYSEFEFGVELTNDIIERKRDISSDPLEKEFIQHLSDVSFVSIFKDLCYVVSFCEDGNLLSQWRGYGSDASGIAIGFRRDKLQELFDTNSWLLKIEYDKNVQKEILELIIKYYLEKAKQIDMPSRIFIYEKNILSLMSELSEILPTFKDPSYKEEKEWRIVYRPTFDETSTKFRIARNIIVPYVELSIGTEWQDVDELIGEVVIGPTRRKDTIFEGVSKVLNDSKLNAILRNSNIPFRED